MANVVMREVTKVYKGGVIAIDGGGPAVDEGGNDEPTPQGRGRGRSRWV